MLKKIITLFLGAVLALSLSACGTDVSKTTQIEIFRPVTSAYDTTAEASETSSEQLPEASGQTTISEIAETTEITETEQTTVLETSVTAETTEIIETKPPLSEMEILTEASTQTTEEAPAVTEPEEQSGKTLVAYFSWSGNTREMAEYIAKQTDGDIFEIIPKTPYPENYTECTEVALAERDGNMRPEIKDLPDDISEYDTLIIGYPIWWHTAPMIIGTFLESYDLTGVEVYPFTQSASMDEEQFENSMDFVRSCSGNGKVHDGLFASASNTSAIDSYLSENGLIR